MKYLALFVLALAQCALAVDMRSAEELPCMEVIDTVPTDVQWMMGIPKWYYLYMSRYDIYAFSLHLTKTDPKDLQEDTVYYDSCINWVMHPANMSYTAYGYGKQTFYTVTPLDPNFGAIEFRTEDGETGRSYTTLTDNSTFIFTVGCFAEQNQLAWTVASPYKTLPNETVQLIHRHAESLGFKKEQFTSQRYDTCPEDTV